MKKILSIVELSAVCQKPDYKTKGNWMVRTFLREWAVPCTWLCLKLGISADQVTAFSIFIAIIGSGLITAASAGSFFGGVLLLQLWYYLDHVDGQIARFHGTASLTGRFFDFMMHHFVHGFLYFCSALFLFFYYENEILLYLGGLSAVSMMSFNLMYDAQYKTFSEAFEKGQTPVVSPPRSDAWAELNRASPSFFKKLFMLTHKMNEIHVAMNLLTAAAVFQMITSNESPRIILAFFFLISPFALVFFKLFFIIRHKKVDAEYQIWIQNFRNKQESL